MDTALFTFAGAVLAAVIAAVANLILSFLNARDFRKLPFLEKQLHLCLEASTVASTLATTRSKLAFKQAHSRFLELYWGPLSVVENRRVASTMILFKDNLDELIKDGAPLPLTDLKGLSYKLAKAIRQLLEEAWKVEELRKATPPKDAVETQDG